MMAIKRDSGFKSIFVDAVCDKEDVGNSDNDEITLKGDLNDLPLVIGLKIAGEPATLIDSLASLDKS